MKYLLSRLKERSTWLGIIAIVTALGAQIETALAEQIIAVGMAVAGMVGIITKDKEEALTDKEDSDRG